MAKSMMQKAFVNMEKIINVDVDKDFLFKNKDGDDEVDWSAKKQYIDIVTTASKTLPDMLKQIEDIYNWKSGSKIPLAFFVTKSMKMRQLNFGDVKP